jgi:hypothetical protein
VPTEVIKTETKAKEAETPKFEAPKAAPQSLASAQPAEPLEEEEQTADEFELMADFITGNKETSSKPSVQVEAPDQESIEEMGAQSLS